MHGASGHVTLSDAEQHVLESFGAIALVRRHEQDDLTLSHGRTVLARLTQPTPPTSGEFRVR